MRRFASRLAEDQCAALAPDTETPFADQVDVVTRLLPYHVFQQPREDLDAVLQSGSIYPSRKGKRKATEEDLLREEIAGMAPYSPSTSPVAYASPFRYQIRTGLLEEAAGS